MQEGQVSPVQKGEHTATSLTQPLGDLPIGFTSDEIRDLSKTFTLSCEMSYGSSYQMKRKFILMHLVHMYTL